jgi:hypothetical protein
MIPNGLIIAAFSDKELLVESKNILGIGSRVLIE